MANGKWVGKLLSNHWQCFDVSFRKSWIFKAGFPHRPINVTMLMNIFSFYLKLLTKTHRATFISEFSDEHLGYIFFLIFETFSECKGKSTATLCGDDERFWKLKNKTRVSLNFEKYTFEFTFHFSATCLNWPLSNFDRISFAVKSTDIHIILRSHNCSAQPKQRTLFQSRILVRNNISQSTMSRKAQTCTLTTRPHPSRPVGSRNGRKTDLGGLSFHLRSDSLTRWEPRVGALGTVPIRKIREHKTQVLKAQLWRVKMCIESSLF